MKSLKPPKSPKGNTSVHNETLHGKTRKDSFAWMKDPNWQQVMAEPNLLHTDIQEYLLAENDYTRQIMLETEAQQEMLYHEMRGRIPEVDSSVPDRDGAYEYYLRYRQGGQHPIICRRETDNESVEQVLLDGDQRAQDHAYFDFGDSGHSPNHQFFAWTEDLNGSENYTLRILTCDSGILHNDRLEDCQGGFEWANDNAHLFYTLLDDQHRPRWIYCHTLGTDQHTDTLVYTEPDPGFFVSVSKTQSGRYILIEAHDHVTSEVYLLDANNAEHAPVLVAARTPGIEYSLSDHGDRLLILTNADEAEDFKLVETALKQTQRSDWSDVLGHRPGTLICDIEIYKDFWVRLERRDALPEIIVQRFSDNTEYSISFDEPAYALSLEGSLEYDTPWLRFRYSSMTTPDQIFDFNMHTQERVLRKARQIPSGHDSGNYLTRRLHAEGHDGQQIPITLLYRKDTAMDGRAPLLLYGYGAYGHALSASFSSARFSLVDRGFIYAIAHVRGGMECGYRWYREGKLAKKTNTFFDYIAAIEMLVATRCCHPGLVFGQGASAGGLLMGAVANLRPDLFKAIIAEVPFVDVLNTMCDASLPLTPPEWPEWGNPLEDAEAYECIAAYSPYDNVKHQDYPNLLVTAGISDPRVTYWEPAKWVARLRQMKTDTNLLLLKTNMQAGHGGAPGRFEALREEALNIAFILKLLSEDSKGSDSDT